ncbi:hypothetical protein GCM10027085_53480 [Spirosoma aerophilum]
MLWILCAPSHSVAQIQGGNGNTNSGPQGNQVIFYRDIKYTGMSRSFSPGNFTNGSLGFLSGNISSIYIPRGWAVTARARNGRTQTFTTSNSMLAQVGWDNQIVSGVITMNQPGGPGGGSGGGNGGGSGNRPVVALYYDLDYRGNMANFATGTFKSLGGDVAQNITSLTVAPGYAVQVFRKPNLKGRSQIFTSSVSDLRRFGWDNQVASIRVSRVN